MLSVHTVNIRAWIRGRLWPWAWPGKGFAMSMDLRHWGPWHGCAHVKQHTIHLGLPLLPTSPPFLFLRCSWRLSVLSPEVVRWNAQHQTVRIRRGKNITAAVPNRSERNVLMGSTDWSLKLVKDCFVTITGETILHEPPPFLWSWHNWAKYTLSLWVQTARSGPQLTPQSYLFLLWGVTLTRQ